MPLPRSVGEAIERYAAKHGATQDGCPLRGPGGCFTEGMERRRVKRLCEHLPPEEGVGMYGFRHYFASNALGNAVPITDVAEWMGHKPIEQTCRSYRHLMPVSITEHAIRGGDPRSPRRAAADGKPLAPCHGCPGHEEPVFAALVTHTAALDASLSAAELTRHPSPTVTVRARSGRAA